MICSKINNTKHEKFNQEIGWEYDEWGGVIIRGVRGDRLPKGNGIFQKQENQCTNTHWIFQRLWIHLKKITKNRSIDNTKFHHRDFYLWLDQSHSCYQEAIYRWYLFKYVKISIIQYIDARYIYHPHSW